MKTKPLFSKLLLILSLVFVLTFVNSCTKDISGDTFLHVTNKIDKKIKIFFDDDKIGKVGANSTESWSVPSGRHLIKVTCPGLDPYKEYLNLSTYMRNELIIEEKDFANNSKIVVQEQATIQDI